MFVYRIIYSVWIILGLRHSHNVLAAISIETNGYRNIVIAISNDVPEDTSILDRLNDVFTEASRKLYVATRNRAFWEEITVLIPESWSDNAIYQPVSGETFGNADIVVQNPDGVDVVHVIRPKTDCGTVDPDAKMYITTARLDEGTLGSWANLLVHEWAHLRYGVFDEYPDAGGPRVYDATNGIREGVRCPLAITGRIERVVDPDTGTVGRCRSADTDCYFVEDTNQDLTGFASLLYKPALEQINMFCDDHDDDESGKLLHNAEAPNKQNRVCNSRSVWDVISSHEDFDGVNPARIVGSPVPTITFKKQQAARTVLVLDVSGSMRTDNRIGRLGQACRSYITDTVTDGEQLGIVWFSTIAAPKKDLTVIDDVTRVEMLNYIPTVPDGYTSIGAGVIAAVQMLNATGTCGGTIIIYTDGEENTPPYLADVEQTAINCGITVQTVAISSAAEIVLNNIVTMTGGEIFLSSIADASNTIIDALRNIAQVNIPVSQRVHTLLSFVYQALPVSASFTETIYIDATVGRNTIFTFDYSAEDILIGLQRPSGVAYDMSSAIVSHDTVFRTYTFTIPDDEFEAGTWTYSVTNPQSSSAAVDVGITVTSQAATPQTATYIPQVYWSQSSIPYPADGLDFVMQIVATLSLGSVPVLNADIRASVDGPSGSTVNVILLDNGAGGDLEANDGIYSAYFMDFAESGRHGVQVQCLGNDNSVANINDVIGDTADDLGNPVAQQDPVPTGNFARVQIGPAFTVGNGFSAGAVTLPPARITDLEVTAVLPENNSVVLEWTAVGNELMSGTAASYDLRRGTSYQQMLVNFDGQQAVTDGFSGSDLQNPRAAYQGEVLTVTVPTSGDITYVFAIKAISSAGTPGELSNIVTVSMADRDDGDDDDDDDDASLNSAVIISSAVLGGMFVFAVFIIILVKVQSMIRSNYERKHASREKLTAESISPYATMRSKSPYSVMSANPYRPYPPPSLARSVSPYAPYPPSASPSAAYWVSPY